MRGQEVRSADNTVVVPLDLRLPQESESEKYAAYMLGLSFPFPLCSQECASSESCFSCHSMRIDEDGGKISARFSPSWRDWRACMQTRTASAQERILGGLSSPVIRDVVGVRSWYPLQDGDEIDPEQQSQSLVLRWALHHMLQPRSCIFVDVPRIHELVAAFLGLFVGFHYTQLSPLEHLSFTQLTWLRRFEQHHAARRLSSSQRRAERFAYISKLEEHGDLEEDDGSVDIEGHDVQDGLGEQDALERQERALHAVALDSLQDVLFREAEWARVLAGRQSRTKETLTNLTDFCLSLGGVPQVQQGLSIRAQGAVGLRRNWTHADAERALGAQKRYLEFLSGGAAYPMQAQFSVAVAFMCFSGSLSLGFVELPRCGHR